jgi:L-threonylcarbamoyladenylate synthase
MIEEVTGLNALSVDGGDEIRVSGSLENHYSPAAAVILDATPVAGQGYIALSHFETPEGAIRLAAPNNTNEFAQCLYESLRKADKAGLLVVMVEQPQGDGIAIAIRDRLEKASKGR